MDEHDDDLTSEVIEGDELERDSFEVEDEDEDDVRSVENSEEGEENAAEDDSEI